MSDEVFEPHCCGDDPPSFHTEAPKWMCRTCGVPTLGADYCPICVPGSLKPPKVVDRGENSSTCSSLSTHCRCRNCGGITKDEAICDSCRFRQIVSERIIGCLREEKPEAYKKARVYLDLLIE